MSLGVGTAHAGGYKLAEHPFANATLEDHGNGTLTVNIPQPKRAIPRTGLVFAGVGHAARFPWLAPGTVHLVKQADGRYYGKEQGYQTTKGGWVAQVNVAKKNKAPTITIAYAKSQVSFRGNTHYQPTLSVGGTYKLRVE